MAIDKITGIKIKNNNGTYSSTIPISVQLENIVGAGSVASKNLGYSSSGNNIAVQADSNGKLYATQNVDSSLSDTSTNPIQNKIVYQVNAKFGPILGFSINESGGLRVTY